MSQGSNIVLIGLMGSGKSTVGKILAKKTKLEFVDLDVYLESKVGKAITTIFEEFGESYFRDIEAQIVEALSVEKNKVISCGGGVVERENNMTALLKNGIIFYLWTSVDQLYQRLSHSYPRPLLQVSDPKKKLEELYNRRNPLYEKYAHYVIKTDGRTPDAIVEEIQERLGRGFFDTEL